MSEKTDKRRKPKLVNKIKFEEEPEYYSFSDNYDYGDVDYEQDYD